MKFLRFGQDPVIGYKEFTLSREYLSILQEV